MSRNCSTCQHSKVRHNKVPCNNCLRNQGRAFADNRCTDNWEPEGFVVESTDKPEQREDNWQHRSSTTSCNTCMFFVEKRSLIANKMEDSMVSVGLDPNRLMHIIGRCRKHAPTLNGWPAVFGDDWCGDHKLDAEKLS